MALSAQGNRPTNESKVPQITDPQPFRPRIRHHPVDAALFRSRAPAR